MKGPDLSFVNETIDYERMKKTGIDFAILRAGYGKDNTDEYFNRHVEGCAGNRIPMGIYWFSYAYTKDMAKREAEYAANHAKKIEDVLFIAFDFEYDSAQYYYKNTGKQITRQTATEIAKAFCDRIKELNYKAVLYANKDYITNYFDIAQIGADLWYAYYNKTSDRNDINIWQYTSEGELDGINGAVDLNIAYEDYTKEQKTEGWVLENNTGKWWYQYADGSYPQNEWKQIDKKWYYFDKDGYMAVGWLLYKEKWYYLKENGQMAEHELLSIKSEIYGIEEYAFSTEGHMLRTNDRGALI